MIWSKCSKMDLADLASQTRPALNKENGGISQQLHYKDFSAARYHGRFVGLGKPRSASDNLWIALPYAREGV
jgi:hypothetical protein